MIRELKVDLTMYVVPEEDETEEEALDRISKSMEEQNIAYQIYETEMQTI